MVRKVLSALVALTLAASVSVGCGNGQQAKSAGKAAGAAGAAGGGLSQKK